MSIDGIGKPGGLPPGGIGGSSGTSSPASGAGESFRAGTRALERSDGAADVTGSEALRALERGELSIEGYLELRVGDATQHLTALSPEQLKLVQDTLRDQLRTDPVLIELVRRATGAVLE